MKPIARTRLAHLARAAGLVALIACKRAPSSGHEDAAPPVEVAQTPSASITPTPTPPPTSANLPPTTPTTRAPTGNTSLLVQCGSDKLESSVPASWVRAAETTKECPARFSLTLPGGRAAWAYVQCLPPQRTGLAQLDALYLRFRNADGSVPSRVGTGYAGISSVGSMRRVHVAASGVLHAPLTCAPAARVGETYAQVTYIVEAPTATFALELGGDGTPDDMEHAIGHTELMLRAGR